MHRPFRHAFEHSCVITSKTSSSDRQQILDGIWANGYLMGE